MINSPFEEIRQQALSLIENSGQFNITRLWESAPPVRTDIGPATSEFFSRYWEILGSNVLISRTWLDKQNPFQFVMLGNVDCGGVFISKMNEDLVYWSTAEKVVPDLCEEDYFNEATVFESIYHLILQLES